MVFLSKISHSSCHIYKLLPYNALRSQFRMVMSVWWAMGIMQSTATWSMRRPSFHWGSRRDLSDPTTTMHASDIITNLQLQRKRHDHMSRKFWICVVENTVSSESLSPRRHTLSLSDEYHEMLLHCFSIHFFLESKGVKGP